jgi:hypothetical protein
MKTLVASSIIPHHHHITQHSFIHQARPNDDSGNLKSAVRVLNKFIRQPSPFPQHKCLKYFHIGYTYVKVYLYARHAYMHTGLYAFTCSSKTEIVFKQKLNAKSMLFLDQHVLSNGALVVFLPLMDFGMHTNRYAYIRTAHNKH